MTEPEDALSRIAHELREDFDRSFAEASESTRPELVQLLLVQVSGQRYALKLSELGNLFHEKRIVPLPGARPGLLGIAAFRGSIVPVYALGALLGHPAAEPAEWVVLAAASDPIAIAFSVFEGQRSVAAAELTGSIVQIDGVPRALVELTPILNALPRGQSQSAHRSIGA